MKKVLIILPLLSCAITLSAQEKKEYTNFNDTTFNIQEVVVNSIRKPRPQISKLEVP